MLNRVMLIGNLCSDPDMRYTAGGDPIATFNVATNRRWKDRNGERKEEVEFHRVTFFGALAKVCGDYLTKGSKIYIDGRIKTDKYQKDGQDVYRTGIVGESMQMLDSKRDGQANNGQATRQAPPRQKAPQQSSTGGYDDYNDDIPFASLNWQIKNHLI